MIAILGGLSLALLVGMIQIMNGQWGLPGNNGWGSNSFSIWDGRMGQPSLRRTTEHDMTDVSQLLVDCSDSNYDVIFLPGDGEKLVVEEYCTRDLEEGEYAQVSSSGQSMEIRQTILNRQKNFFVFRTGEPVWGYLKLYLPQEAYAGLLKLAVNTKSGNINLPKWRELAPERIMLREAQFTASSGDVELEYVKADQIQISTSSGYIKSEYLEGNQIKIKASSGDVTLTEAAGDMSVDTTSGDISIRTSAGALEISTSSGDVETETVKGDVRIGTSSGYVRSGKIDGNLKVNTSSGDVTAKYVGGNAEIDTSSGYIVLGEVRGSLNATSSSGSHEVDSVGGNVHTQSVSGDQSIGSAGGSVEMKSSSGLIELYGLQKEARFQTTSGGVTAVITEMGGNVTVSSSSGDVRIKVPESGPFYLDVSTSSGGIDTSFDDMLEFNKRGNKATGTIGGDAYRMEIGTTSGEVEIRAH